MRIRPARLDDFEALCGLWEALDERQGRARPDLFRVPPGERRERDLVARRIEGPESTMLVAKEGADLLGFCTALVQHRPATPVRDERRLVEVDELVVRPDRRRCGVASALLDAALAWAREQPGVTSVELNVWDFNDEARAFYEAQGFETLVRRMGRPLTPPQPRRPCPSPVPPSGPGNPGQGLGAGTGAGLGGWRARWRAWRQGGGAGRMRGDVAGRAHPPGGVRTERCVLDRLGEADRRCLP